MEIFPNSQIGTITEQVQQVRNNVIQATIASTGALASYYPKIDALNLPFAFSSNASTYEVYDGEFGQALAADMEEDLGDVKVLGFPDTGGFFAVTNSARPIESLDDFDGMRVRTMTLPSHQTIMNALGAQSYPLAFGELYSTLQTGVIASRGLSRMIEASERGISRLSESMEITSLTPDQRQNMRDATLPAFEAHIEETLGEDGLALLDGLRQHAAEANAETYMTSESGSGSSE